MLFGWLGGGGGCGGWGGVGMLQLSLTEAFVSSFNCAVDDCREYTQTFFKRKICIARTELCSTYWVLQFI